MAASPQIVLSTPFSSDAGSSLADAAAQGATASVRKNTATSTLNTADGGDDI